MATVPCPSCGLPRAEDATAACPVCGKVGLAPGPDEPDDDQPWVIAEPPRHTVPLELDDAPPRRSGVAAGTVLGFILGIGTGAAGLFGWQAYHDRPPAPEPITVAQADPPAIEAPPEKPPVARASSPEAPPPKPVRVPPPRETVVVEPLPLPPNPFRPAAPPAMRLDNPDGESRPVVRPGGHLVLRGKVKTLRVAGLEAGAVLDCTDLEVEDIEVVGKIDGASRLTVRAPAGRVTFLGPVDGGSTVEVRAKAVAFRVPIRGVGTRVSVRLTAGGTLSFAAVGGLARLEYAKADPADPDPVVTRGRVEAPAVVARVE